MRKWDYGKRDLCCLKSKIPISYISPSPYNLRASKDRLRYHNLTNWNCICQPSAKFMGGICRSLTTSLWNTLMFWCSVGHLKCFSYVISNKAKYQWVKSIVKPVGIIFHVSPPGSFCLVKFITKKIRVWKWLKNIESKIIEKTAKFFLKLTNKKRDFPP